MSAPLGAEMLCGTCRRGQNSENCDTRRVNDEMPGRVSATIRAHEVGLRPSLVLWGPKEAGCAPFCSYTKTQTVLGLLQGQKPLHNSCESSRGVLGAAGSLPPVAPPAFTPKRKSFSAFWGSKLAGGARGGWEVGAEHRFEPAFCSRRAFWGLFGGFFTS